MDKTARGVLEDIANKLPLITIEGYKLIQKQFKGKDIKRIFKLKATQDGQKIKDNLIYFISTPDSIRRTHLANLKQLWTDNESNGNFAPCQEYIDKVTTEFELVESTKHEVSISMEDEKTPEGKSEDFANKIMS